MSAEGFVKETTANRLEAADCRIVVEGFGKLFIMDLNFPAPSVPPAAVSRG